MGSDEPSRLALVVLIGGLLLVTAALATRASRRGPIPLMLVFLIVGMAAGSEGLGGIEFDDHVLAYQTGTVALVLILFDGGLQTRFARVRAHLPPAIVLATIGVVLTAALLAGGAYLIGAPLHEALLVAAVVSSTDAAAVFSVLRGTGMNLQARVSATIELESGLNDPMAVLLTAAVVEFIQAGDIAFPLVVLHVILQLVIGAACGIALGWVCRLLLEKLPPTTVGLVPVITVATAGVAYGGATLIGGSGFLAVFVCGLLLGTRNLPLGTGLRRVHDFLAWSSQVTLFLTLGLLVDPSQLGEVAAYALGVSAIMVLVARPLAVWLCLLPFRYPAREIAYVGWVGLRGAVPIVLATYPLLMGVPAAQHLFNVVFFIVLVSLFVQATSVRGATTLLRLTEPAPPAPHATLEIASMQLHDELIACYHVDQRAAVAGVTIAEVPFPENAAVMLIVRDKHLIPPRGPVRIEPGDHVYVFCKPEDEPAVALWFGQRMDL